MTNNTLDFEIKPLDRYPIGTRIHMYGQYVGTIVGYGSDDDESYLVDCYAALAITNKAMLSNKGVNMQPPRKPCYEK